MKTYFLTIFFSVFSVTTIFSQYKSVFGSYYTEWNYLWLICDAGFVETFVHEKDTIIENVSYNIVNDFGLLRESDQHSKLWYRPFDTEEDILIMDLNLIKGDTFSFGALQLIVDTVFIENDFKIIEFDYMPYHCGYYEKLRFVEGRGVNFSFRFSLNGSKDDAWVLRCLTRDSFQTNYLLPFDIKGDCRIGTVSVKDETDIEVVVFPNPADQWLQFMGGLNEFESVEIFNQAGLCMIKSHVSQINMPVHVQSWPPGLYFVRLKRPDKITWLTMTKM